MRYQIESFTNGNNHKNGLHDGRVFWGTTYVIIILVEVTPAYNTID